MESVKKALISCHNLVPLELSIFVPLAFMFNCMNVYFKHLNSKILMYRPKCLKVQIEATFLDQIKGIYLCIYTLNFLVHILVQMKDIEP
jgi:hypothetical protein